MFRIRTMMLVAVLTLLPGLAFAEGKGILLLAHGGSAQWNGHVTALAKQVNDTIPTEVAFGMATRATIQSGVDRLAARGVKQVVAVPLFISSWSSIITSTEYLLGLRKDAPADLAVFAKMSHGQPAATGATATAGHRGHGAEPTIDGTKPISSSVPIRLTAALNDHPIVADILTSRARTISKNSAEEAVILVAHGPNDDEDNRRWLAAMASLARRIGGQERFASIDYLTVRDDAEKAVRDQATGELRGLVEKRIGEGRRVLIVPLLVSFGGIDRGVRQRLEGLTYTMPAAALAPDDRLVTWVLDMAGQP